MLALGHLVFSMRVTSVMVPVGLYFLILGLLNTRQHPQLLTARRDYALLAGALSPLLLIPAVMLLGQSFWAMLGAGGLVAAGGLLLVPRGPRWVVYNLSLPCAQAMISGVLVRLGWQFDHSGQSFRLGAGGMIRLGAFPLLRNITIQMTGATEAQATEFEAELSRAMSHSHARHSPAMAALLLAAATMLVIPVTLVAPRAGEVVAILSDMLK
ncbi:MAG: hypothetical protein ABFD92_06185 [Planctomycetaceae bacterium]|nr:hypothetical protein [Planctomycetaceae bacterium]